MSVALRVATVVVAPPTARFDRSHSEDQLKVRNVARKGVQYYEAVSREFRGLSGCIWQKYWTDYGSKYHWNHVVIDNRAAAFEPGGRRFESVRARSNTPYKSMTSRDSTRAKLPP